MKNTEQKYNLLHNMPNATDKARYLRAARKLCKLQYEIHSRICSNCGVVFWASTSEKVCNICIKNRYDLDDVSKSIEISDRDFKTDICDGDCANCKFEDCQLPE